MVQMCANDSETQPVVKNERESLLKKFDIPIGHLDFEYLKNCNNSKEIEKIYEILRSGEEGYFPDLLEFTKKRLFEVNPKSKLLQTTVRVLSKCDVPKDEWEELSSDLQDWIENVGKNDKELISFQDIKSKSTNLPIRESTVNRKNKGKSKTGRIKSMDYEAWDKLDVDTEILKMDIKDEKLKQEALKEIKEKEKLNTVILDPDIMTKAELNHAALQAKNAGNECYKLGEYEDALQYYTNSLTFVHSATVYNNRAITNIKLKKYEDALKDCNEVLKSEKENEKAYLRKSTAYKLLKQYDKGIENLEIFLQMNPNSVDAQNLMQDLRKLLGKKINAKTVRIKILEHAETRNSKNRANSTETNKPNSETNSRNDIQTKDKMETVKKSKNNTCRKRVNTKESDDKEVIDNVLVPIPSTSTFSGPFYKVLNLPANIAKKITNTSKTHAKSDENIIDLSETHKRNCRKISPYEFLKRWQAVKDDPNLLEHEELLRSIDPSSISDVVGNKLDGEMFSLLLKCLVLRFTKPDDRSFIETILFQLQKIPRINIIILLMDDIDKNNVRILLSRIENKVLECIYGG